MKTLMQATQELIKTNAKRNPYYKDLTDSQREQLTAIAIQSMQPDGKKLGNLEIGNCEAIDDVVISKAFMTKIIEALNEQDIADRNVLLKEIGEMLLQGAIKHCEKDVSEALDEAVTQLAKARHFHDDDYEVKRLIADDNRQRARDMQKEYRV